MQTIRVGNKHYRARIRQSDMGAFFMCPEQARLRFAGKLPRRTTAAMAQGNAVHGGFEATLAHGATRTEACDVVAWMLENALEQPDFEFGDVSEDKFFRDAFACFDAGHDWLLPHIGDVLAVEHNFNLPFTTIELPDGTIVDVELTGTIDCITSTGIWDWKTANSSWKSSAWEKDRWAVQPTIYSWAVSQLGFDTDPTKFTFGVMIKGKDPADEKSSEMVEVRRDERHWEWLRQQIEPIVMLLMADLPKWPLHDQGWWCSGKWCPVWSQCKGSHAEGRDHLTF